MLSNDPKDIFHQKMTDHKNGRGMAADPIDLEKIREHHEQLQKDLETAQKSDDTEDRFDTIVYGPLSMSLAHVFIRRGISANKVTLLSLVFGVFGSIFFYSQNVLVNFLGIVIEFFAVVLDCADGQVARMTHTTSQLGRFLDGIVDTTNFFAIYVVIAIRMTNETIPFTAVKWGVIIWIVLLINGYFHGEEARMADYYRTIHLYFLDRSNTAHFTSSEKIKEELAAAKDSPFYNKLYLYSYYIYTRDQERMSPNMQKLLKAIEENGGTISDELSDAYTARSRKYVQLTNLLTFNLRAYVLYLLILLKLHPWFVPFNILILGGIALFMIAKYEKIAKEVYEQFFA